MRGYISSILFLFRLAGLIIYNIETDKQQKCRSNRRIISNVNSYFDRSLRDMFLQRAVDKREQNDVILFSLLSLVIVERGEGCK
jgi:hypothetical protein